MFHSRRAKPGGEFLIINDGKPLSDDLFTIRATENLVHLLRQRYNCVRVADVDHFRIQAPIPIPEMTERERSRFLSYVEKGPACWGWKRGHSEGYAVFWLRGRPVLAHRVSYELLVGEIPRGLTIDHLCRNTGCVNPDHLEPATWPENLRRALAYHRGGRLRVWAA